MKGTLDDVITGVRAILEKRTELQQLNRPIMTMWNTSALTESELQQDRAAVEAGFRPYGGSGVYPGKQWMGSYCQPITHVTPGGFPTESAIDAKTVAENLMHSTRRGHERVCSDSVNQWFTAWIQLNVEDWIRGVRKGEKGRGGPNLATAWWDMDSTYGTGFEEIDAIRTHKDGKVDADKLASKKEIGQWAGISALKFLLAKEHNLIAEKLSSEYSDFAGDDEKLFGVARLITVATVARIHTVHWTSILLQTRATQIGQITLWDGVVSALTGLPRTVARALASIFFFLGKDSKNTMKGLAGGVMQEEYDFAWPEEFGLVYRLHPMLPDSLQIGGRAVGMQELAKPANSFGYDKVAQGLTEGSACALTLQNFPDDLTNLTLFTGGPAFDLAEHDIMATRARGLGSFNDFRRGMHLDPATSFENLVTDGGIPTPRDERIIASLKKVYPHVEDVDAVIGMLAEPRLSNSLLGMGQYLVFVLMTQTRLESDPFFTEEKWKDEFYTRFGMNWIKQRTFGAMLNDHFGIEQASDHDWAGFMAPGWQPSE